MDLIIADILLSRGMSRNEVNRELPKHTSTKALCEMFKKLGESPHDKTTDPNKRKANAVEEYLFQYFLATDYKTTRQFIKEVLPK